MLDEICELAIWCKGAGIQLVDGVADAVALVGIAVCVAGVGRFSHPDADVLHRDFPRDEFEGDGAALAVRNNAGRECLPDSFGGSVIERLSGAGPKLNDVAASVRLGPSDAGGVAILLACTVGGRVAVGEAGVFGPVSAGETAMGQRVGPGVADRIGGIGAAGEIAFLLFWITPNAARIPVPGLDLQIGILAIGDGLSTGVENLLEDGIGEQVIRASGFQSIDTRAESANGAERIHGVGWIG